MLGRRDLPRVKYPLTTGPSTLAITTFMPVRRLLYLTTGMVPLARSSHRNSQLEERVVELVFTPCCFGAAITTAGEWQRTALGEDGVGNGGGTKLNDRAALCAGEILAYLLYCVFNREKSYFLMNNCYSQNISINKWATTSTSVHQALYRKF